MLNSRKIWSKNTHETVLYTSETGNDTNKTIWKCNGTICLAEKSTKSFVIKYYKCITKHKNFVTYKTEYYNLLKYQLQKDNKLYLLLV